MKTVSYEIKIQCSREKVFSAMLDEEQYKQWTAVFAPGSRYKGKWEEGATIEFFAETKDGKTGGMKSLIEKLIPNELVRIRHLAMFENKKQQSFEDSDFYEVYHYLKEGENTLLKVELDTNDEWIPYFDKTFPKALEKLKEICEQNC